MGTRPAVRAYMLSLLAVRKLALGDQFAAKFPHPWLVWEPGVWQPARGVAAATLIGGSAQGQRPGQGDALCFELVERRPVRIGRAPDCDVVINDATVSRDHLQFEPAGDAGWQAKVASHGTGATVMAPPGGGAAIRLSQAPTAIPLGATLVLGDVTLTFVPTSELARRLDTVLKAAKPP